MNAMTDQATKFRHWYNRWGPVIVGLCYVIGATAAVIGVVGIRANGATQDEQARLLACFDQYARVSSTSSRAVREATVVKDTATASRDAALDVEGRAFLHVVKRILEQKVNEADFQRLNDALQHRAGASRVLERAQAKLDHARAANPVPDPPSVFCDKSKGK